MRVFLDTNVLIAAFASRGLCEDVFRIVLTEHSLLTGSRVVQELERILEEKLQMPLSRVQEVSSFICRQGELVDASRPAAWPKNDPDDRWILAAAIDAAADVLVTGDRDLLDITAQLPLAIVSPREFWERLRS